MKFTFDFVKKCAHAFFSFLFYNKAAERQRRLLYSKKISQSCVNNYRDVKTELMGFLVRIRHEFPQRSPIIRVVLTFNFRECFFPSSIYPIGAYMYVRDIFIYFVTRA